MVLVALLLLPATAQAATVTGERSLGGRGIELTIDTPAFAGPAPVRVFLPAGYDAEPRRRWPVVYYLAGTNHTERSFDEIYDGEELTASFPAIVVVPRGDSGYWSDWFNGGAFGPPMYETFVIDELLPLIDERFRTKADGAFRAILGESMGGYGVMSYAARHPDLFTAASSLSGALNTNNPAGTAALSVTPTLQGGAPDAINGPRATEAIRWHGGNPWDLADNLRDVDLQVRVGSALPTDTEGLVPADVASCALEAAVRDFSTEFHERLLELDVPHDWTLYERGCHSPEMFKREIVDSLPAFARAFANPRPAPERFTYRSIEPRFAVWGWDVAADPARGLEFLRLSDVSRSGLTLEGSGTTRVTTPPLFARLRKVDVDDTVVAPDASGRLTFEVDLGPAHTTQAQSAAIEGERRTVALRPHARILLTRAAGRRVCARVIGGRARGARVRVGGRTRRLTLRRTATCRRVGTRVAGRRVVIRARDGFGHRVRAVRR